MPGTLSGTEQQMLSIGHALMIRPKRLLLDEPSMGLAPVMAQKIFEVIRAVAVEGMIILLIEQNTRLALKNSQLGYVMKGGEITLAGVSGLAQRFQGACCLSGRVSQAASQPASRFPADVRYFVVDRRDSLIGKTRYKRDTRKIIVCP